MWLFIMMAAAAVAVAGAAGGTPLELIDDSGGEEEKWLVVLLAGPGRLYFPIETLSQSSFLLPLFLFVSFFFLSNS